MKRSLAPAPQADSISEAVGAAWLKILRQVNNNLKSPPTPPTYPLRGIESDESAINRHPICSENRDSAPESGDFLLQTIHILH